MPTPVYQHQFHQSITYKIYLCRKPGIVAMNFEQAMEVIRQVHALTGGVKQIIYLVGWQYDGHDSKYPAFFEVNHRLKRAEDQDAAQSLRWLMKEAAAYNTVVSVHINLCDAYENSPLWEEYVQKDLLVRELDGAWQKGGIWDGEQSYRVSKTREWALGLTQRRIQQLLALLPLVEAGTVHIDAFNPKPSPFHGVTHADEVVTVQAIMRYWQSLGIDVTGELYLHEYAGLMPMAYHLNMDEHSRINNSPASICGGGPNWNARQQNNAEDVAWVGVFTAPEAGCYYEEAWGYSLDYDIMAPGELADFVTCFYLHSLPWLYMNQREIIDHLHSRDSYEVRLTGNLVSRVTPSDRHYTLTEDGQLLVDGTNICIPAAWDANKLIAFSLTGMDQCWPLPSAWQQVQRVTVRQLYPLGNSDVVELPVQHGELQICLMPGQAMEITRS